MPETPDEELVRRLLADARHDAPMPADVVARLDDVLEGLADERRATVPARRHGPRRRRWATALVAAAAVVVAGVAVRAGWPGGETSSSSGAASSTADSSAGEKSDNAAGAPPAVGAPVALHRATLAADVRGALTEHRNAFVPLAPEAAPELAACLPPGWGAGEAVLARLDGRPVLLVLRPASGGSRVGDVLACGSGRELASVRIPAG